MNKESLKYVLAQATQRPLPVVEPRDIQIPLQSGKVVGLVGVRRSGKTFLMFDTIRRLLDKGVARKQIIYLSLEDDRLYPVDPSELDLILIAHAELYPDAASEERYLFLDEVQAVPGWERYVRRIHDTEKVQVFVTGSSSGLMSRDLAPMMRGRSVSFEVFPLSFREFTRFRGVADVPYSRQDEARLAHALEDYLRWGGLPEIVTADEALRPLILEEYAALIFFRDLVERYGVRNERAMRLLLKYCATRPASLLSVHRLHGDFRSQGMSVSKNTLYEYLEYLRDASLVFTVPKHDASVARQEQNPRKIHLIDMALVRAYAPDPDRDLGHKLENVVFLSVRRRSKELFYYSNAHEIDLVSVEAGQTLCVHVAWSLTAPETRQREQAALEFAARRYPGARNVLVAHETEAGAMAAPPLPAVPAWRYLLEA